MRRFIGNAGVMQRSQQAKVTIESEPAEYCTQFKHSNPPC
jgi:hypothetical protein